MTGTAICAQVWTGPSARLAASRAVATQYVGGTSTLPTSHHNPSAAGNPASAIAASR